MSAAGRHADRAGLLPADGPLRHTSRRGPTEMTRRAGRLVGMHLLVPGSVQMVAGNRAVGRAVVAVWAAIWALVLAALLTWLLARDVLVAVVTSSTGLSVLQVGLLLVAVGWLAVTVDVLRIARVLRLTRWARPLIAGGLAVAAVLGSGAAAWGAYVAGVARGTITSVFRDDAPAAAAVDPADVERYDVLLLGMDRPAGGGALVPESVSVASIDARTGRATVIGMPTTLGRVPFPSSSPLHRLYPDGYRACIAEPCTLGDVYREARAVGSSLYPDASAEGLSPAAAAMRDAASGVLGRRVRFVVQVDTTSLGALVDALGGVRVQVQRGTPGFRPGSTAMTGTRVVRYLRAGGGGTGTAQVDRVLQVETALLQQVDPANALLQFRRIAAASSGALRTNIPQQTVTDLAVLGLRTRSGPIRRVRLAPPVVRDLDAPDYAAVHRLIAATAG